MEWFEEKIFEPFFLYMLIKLRPYFQLVLFWLAFFAVQRLLFLIANHQFLGNNPLDFIRPFVYALNVDLSVVAYFSIPLFSLYFITLMSRKQWLLKGFYIVLCLLILFSTVLNTVDVLLYESWNTKMNYKILQYIQMPEAAWGTVSALQVFLFFLYFIFQLAAAWILFNRFLRYEMYFDDLIQTPAQPVVKTLAVGICIYALIFLGIRGGVQEIPINPSAAFHNTNFIYNYAALNSTFNLFYNIYENRKTLNTNPYLLLPRVVSKKRIDSLYHVTKDTTQKIFILGKEAPNIVFILMEGINANLLSFHNHSVSGAPFLDSMIHQGLYFSECYSSGFRTDQGLPAVLSGHPSQPYTAIVTQNDKLQKLETITRLLKKRKYNTLFSFGGEPEFGNIKSYLIHNHFDKMISIYDFPITDRTQKLGVPDHLVMKEFKNELYRIKKPFFAMCLTQSTHEPYDMPFNDGIRNENKRYQNTVKYMDSCLKVFFSQVQKEKWFANTVFIISADHAHTHPGNFQPGMKERFHIPLLIYAPRLQKQFKGKVCTQTIDQVDIANTLLRQLDIKSSGFRWSKNYFNPYQQKFSFSTYINGQIFVKDTTDFAFEYRFMKLMDIPAQKSNHARNGLSMMQEVMDEYLKF